MEERYAEALAILKWEQRILYASIVQANPQAKLNLPTEDISDLFSQMPKNYQSCLAGQMALSNGWKRYREQHAMLASLISEDKSICPWYPLRYFLPVSSIEAIPASATPLVFLEPLASDFSVFTRLQERPALFVFGTRADFIQMLQFKEFLEILSDPSHLIYILDLYPNHQFALQEWKQIDGRGFYPIFLTPRKQIEKCLPLIQQALGDVLKQSHEELKQDTDSGNWLYRLAKDLLFSIQEERLGINRAPALLTRTIQDKLDDPHKALPARGTPPGFESKNYMGVKLSELAATRVTKKKRDIKEKIKLVHVVSQVVDDGHAPSRLLENLVLGSDQAHFDLALISTERMQLHIHEYPLNFTAAPSSKEWGAKRLALFQQRGVPCFFIGSDITYEEAAKATASLLKKLEADVAIFHGSGCDQLNVCAAFRRVFAHFV